MSNEYLHGMFEYVFLPLKVHSQSSRKNKSKRYLKTKNRSPHIQSNRTEMNLSTNKKQKNTNKAKCGMRVTKIHHN